MKVEGLSSPTNGFRFPAEWEPHAATWLAWPHRQATFLGDFDEVPRAFSKLVRLLACYEPVRVIGSHDVLCHASSMLEGVGQVDLIEIPIFHYASRHINRVWLRREGSAQLYHHLQ